MERSALPTYRLLHSVALLTLWLILAPTLTGCTSWFKKKEPDVNTQLIKDTKRIKELMKSPDRPRLIGEIAVVSGLVRHQYDSYGLVVGLPGTGGKVHPGEARNLILNDMRIRKVDSPETKLDADWSALAKVRAFSNPGDRDREVLDILVEMSDKCDGTDLSGGLLLETRLREMVNVGGRVRSSDDKATAEGELVVLPRQLVKENYNVKKAIIVGGGRSLQPRRMSVLVKSEFKHTMIINAIQEALNKRFFFHESSKQRMLAEGKSDYEVSIRMHPKYQWDASHFASVVVATGFHEDAEQQKERIEGCKKLLLDRTTARRAAAELESLGSSQAADVLISGLSSIDTEVRFYSAYSLAYLDRKEASPVLADIAKKESAFRPLCLVGLAVSEHSSAKESLVKLLQESIPELRYGALWAIRQRDSAESMVQGEKLSDLTQLIQIPSDKPLIAVSLQTKQEVVLFGNSETFTVTSPITPTPFLSITPVSSGQLKLVRRFSGDSIHAFSPPDVLSLIRTLGAVNASYNDIVQTLNVLHEQKIIKTLVAFNPRPQAGRVFHRESDPNDDEEATIAVDASSREKDPNPWWYVPGWFSTSSSSSTAKSNSPEPSPSAHDPNTPIDLDANMQLTPPNSGAPSSTISNPANSNSSGLPEIDWDALK